MVDELQHHADDDFTLSIHFLVVRFNDFRFTFHDRVLEEKFFGQHQHGLNTAFLDLRVRGRQKIVDDVDDLWDRDELFVLQLRQINQELDNLRCQLLSIHHKATFNVLQLPHHKVYKHFLSIELHVIHVELEELTKHVKNCSLKFCCWLRKQSQALNHERVKLFDGILEIIFTRNFDGVEQWEIFKLFKHWNCVTVDSWTHNRVKVMSAIDEISLKQEFEENFGCDDAVVGLEGNQLIKVLNCFFQQLHVFLCHGFYLQQRL